MSQILTANAPTNGSVSVPAPRGAGTDTEVIAKPARRRFSAEYKRRILQEASACAPGEIGALLRREGLYSSHLTHWRRQQATGELAGLTAKKRGPKVDAQAVELARLKRENERLQVKLQQTEAIIGAQKKLAELFGATQALNSATESWK
jgi:transposase-like protein